MWVTMWAGDHAETAIAPIRIQFPHGRHQIVQIALHGAKKGIFLFATFSSFAGVAIVLAEELPPAGARTAKGMGRHNMLPLNPLPPFHIFAGYIAAPARVHPVARVIVTVAIKGLTMILKNFVSQLFGLVKIPHLGEGLYGGRRRIRFYAVGQGEQGCGDEQGNGNLFHEDERIRLPGTEWICNQERHKAINSANAASERGGASAVAR